MGDQKSDPIGGLTDRQFSILCPFCGSIIPVRLTKKSLPFLWCARCGVLTHFRGRNGLRALGRRMFVVEEVPKDGKSAIAC